MQFERVLLKAVEESVSDKIDAMIADEVNAFHKRLVEQKDEYMAEIMKGIRIAHQYNPENMYMDYRIMFINKYEV